MKNELLLDHTEWMLTLGADGALAVSIRSCSLPSDVSGKQRRLPSRIATLNSTLLPTISGLMVMPW
jgi:hypothetical protein